MNEWMNEMGKQITDQKTTTTTANIDPNLEVNSIRWYFCLSVCNRGSYAITQTQRQQQ